MPRNQLLDPQSRQSYRPGGPTKSFQRPWSSKIPPFVEKNTDSYTGFLQQARVCATVFLLEETATYFPTFSLLIIVQPLFTPLQNAIITQPTSHVFEWFLYFETEKVVTHVDVMLDIEEHQAGLAMGGDALAKT